MKNTALEMFANRVRVRVCGICLDADKVLVVQHGATVANTAFWAPPGGGLNYGETVQGCLAREMAEETGLEIKVGRFLYLNEFLQEPLHALELFFEVTVQGGQLQAGTDPELTTEKQLIRSVQYLTLQELNRIPPADKHSIFHNLVSLDDLLLPLNRFL